MKVPHHGGNIGSCEEELYDAVSPTWIIVSGKRHRHIFDNYSLLSTTSHGAIEVVLIGDQITFKTMK